MKVVVSSLMMALELSQECDKVISLVDPDEVLPDFHLPHLVVHMHDTEVAADSWSPKLDDIIRVFDFVDKDDRVLVHCYAGISRSTAMGLGLLVSAGVSVQDALTHVHADRPNMSPNKLILRLIDDHLQMCGKFISDMNVGISTLTQDLWLWCNDCKIHFKDNEGGCIHFRTNHAD